MKNTNFYKGWDIFYSPIGSQNWVAKKHGVTMRTRKKEYLYPMIDDHETESKKPWIPELTKEDIKNFATPEEKKFLKENYGTSSAVYALDREVRQEMEEELELLWNESDENLEEFKRKIKIKGDWPVDDWRDVYIHGVRFLQSSGYTISLK